MDYDYPFGIFKLFLEVFSCFCYFPLKSTFLAKFKENNEYFSYTMDMI